MFGLMNDLRRPTRRPTRTALTLSPDRLFADGFPSVLPSRMAGSDETTAEHCAASWNEDGGSAVWVPRLSVAWWADAPERVGE
jgi:hypothetical protein